MSPIGRIRKALSVGVITPDEWCCFTLDQMAEISAAVDALARTLKPLALQPDSEPTDADAEGGVISVETREAKHD